MPTGIYKRTSYHKEILRKNAILGWNSGAMLKRNFKDKNHPLWKGSNVGHAGLHKWIRRKLGKPKRCENCRTTKGRIEWSSISHKTKRDLKDYRALCVKCHRNYDSPKQRKEKMD